MAKRSFLSLAHQVRVAAIVKEVIAPAGGDFWQYLDGWNDARVAEEAQKREGIACTSANVLHVREELHGKLKPGGAGASLSLLAALEERVVKLEGVAADLTLRAQNEERALRAVQDRVFGGDPSAGA